MRVLVLVLACGVLVGCLKGKYTKERDDFTGQMVENARIGNAASGTVVVHLHARLEGSKPLIIVYVVNAGLRWPDRVDFKTDKWQFSLRCKPNGITYTGVARFTKAACPMGIKQAQALALSSSIRWRSGGVVGKCTTDEMGNVARVFGGLSSGAPTRPPTYRRKPKKREAPVILPDPPTARDDD